MERLKKFSDKVFVVLAKGSFKARLGIMAFISFIVAECPMAAYAMPVNDITIKDGDSSEISDTVTAPMKTLIKVILAVMAVVGVFMFVKSILELINAVQQQDNSGMFHAGRSMAVSLLMMAITPIVNLFVDL